MSWVFQVFTNLASKGDDPSDPRHIWEVGFYDPNGDFIMAYQVPAQSAAADLVHYLNGGSDSAIREVFESPIEVQGHTVTSINTDPANPIGVEVHGSINTSIDP
jgi:hypothetical protein